MYLASIVLITIPGPHTPGVAVTDCFFVNVKGLLRCINEFAVFETTSQGGIDWEATVRNYDGMHAFVKAFCADWGFYFFIAEFPAFLCFVLMGVGLWYEVSHLHSLVANGCDDKCTLLMSRLPLGVSALVATLQIVVQLWISASQVTEACHKVRQQGLRAQAQVLRGGYTCTDERSTFAIASLSSPPSFSEEYSKTRGFHEYMLLRNLGFSYKGVTISY